MGGLVKAASMSHSVGVSLRLLLETVGTNSFYFSLDLKGE